MDLIQTLSEREILILTDALNQAVHSLQMDEPNMLALLELLEGCSSIKVVRKQV